MIISNIARDLKIVILALVIENLRQNMQFHIYIQHIARLCPSMYMRNLHITHSISDKTAYSVVMMVFEPTMPNLLVFHCNLHPPCT